MSVRRTRVCITGLDLRAFLHKTNMTESDFIYSLTVDQRKAYNALKVLRRQKVTTELDKALERLTQIRTIRDKRDEESLLTDTIIYISNAMYYSATSQLDLEL